LRAALLTLELLVTSLDLRHNFCRVAQKVLFELVDTLFDCAVFLIWL